MNKQKNNKNQQEMSKAIHGAVPSREQQQQTRNPKQQASKAEYGASTTKEDVNKDYE